MKFLLQGLFAFEAIMMVATFVAHIISKVIGDVHQVSMLKIYLLVASITLVAYLLIVAITFVPLR